MVANRKIPNARLHRVDGHRPAQAVGARWTQLVEPVRSSAVQGFRVVIAFSPLFAVVAFAIILLWTAGMSGSP